MVLFALFLALILFFSLPVVQNSIGDRVTSWLNSEYKTNINVERVGVSFLGNVSLKGVYVEDYKKDTLIYINDLSTSILSLKKAIGGRLEFGKIRVDDLKFYIKTYKGEKDTNLDVFVEKLDSGESDPNAEPFFLSSTGIFIKNSHFKMTDEDLEKPNVLNFMDLNVEADHFTIRGPEVTTHIRDLNFVARKGLVVTQLDTRFSYSKTRMIFDDIKLLTLGSGIFGNLQFDYNREEFSDFINKVQVSGSFVDSEIALDEVNIYYDQFGKGKKVHVSTDFKGVLNDLYTKNLKLDSERSKIRGDFDFVNLFDSDRPFKIDGNIENISSNYYQLVELMPNIFGKSLPSSFAKLGQFSLNGRAVITQEMIDAELGMNTDIGKSYANLRLTNIDHIDNASYIGELSLEEFDIGMFFNDKKLGKTTLDFNIDGTGFTQENLNTEIKGKIFAITYNNYSYQDVDVSGILKNQLFDGKLVSNDENLDMAFEGLADFSGAVNEFNFRADIDYADLKKLNIFTRDSISLFKGNLYVDVTGNTFYDLTGEIIISRTNFTNDNDSYYFEDLKMTSEFEDGERVIEIFSPDVIEGYIRGKFRYQEVGKIVRNSIGSIYTNYQPFEISPDQYIDFNFQIYNKLVEVFVPGLEFGKNTSLKGSMVADKGDFRVTFKSPKIDLYGRVIDSVALEINNKNPLYNTFLEIGSIDAGVYKISDFNLINATLRDTLFFRTEFKGGDDHADIYNLNFYHTFGDDQRSVIGLKPSDIGFKGNHWVINKENNNKNKVTFDKTLDSIRIEEIVMNYREEQIHLKGMIIDSTFKDISLKFDDVNLDKITPDIDSLQLGGIVNGNFNIFQRNKVYMPSSNISIEDLKINRVLYGDLDLGIVGNNDLSKFGVDARIINDQIESLNLRGDIDIHDNGTFLNLKAHLQELDLSAFSPLGEDVISDIRGHATGTANISGPLGNPDINGELLVSNGGLKIPYLNVDVDLDKASRIKLHNQTFEFDNITLTDKRYNTRSVLFGTINHTGFDDWYLDLKLDTRGNKFLVLNTPVPDSDEVLYYGTGFISGKAQIYGLTDELTIKVDGKTEAGTSLKIPVSDVTSIGDASFINFIDKTDMISEVEKRRQLAEYKGLELDFDLDVTPEAEVEIVLDKKTGSSLRGTGAGNLLIEINTNGKFKMWGDFITYKGDYNFKYGGIIDKKFEVLPGGTINWDGDPLTANVNIQGVYSLYANPAVLLDNAQYTRKIRTEVVIGISGELLKPNLDYEIRFPSANAVTNSELQYRIEDRSKRELQALSLLAQGVFINEVSINTGQALASNIAETASSIVNQVLNSGDGKFNFGLNYEVGERNQEMDYVAEDRVGVTVSTQINERILINGKIGVPVGGVSETVVAGDVEVQILLNEDGTLSAKIFNRENEIQQFLMQQQGYTQGVGLSYRVDFDTFSDLLRKIFVGKEKTDQKDEASVKDDKESMGNNLVNFTTKEKTKK